MKNTNVKLSENEMDLVTNPEFILTKNEIIKKVYDLFGILSDDYKKIIEGASFKLPDQILKVSPKIYKGEKYLDLPYVMLDYPRCFLKEDVFAVRSFFWWGNFFSISLQLAGNYQQQYLSTILKNSKSLQQNNWFAYTGDDVWQHNFIEEQNIKLNGPNNDSSIEKFITKPFFKITKTIPLQKWEEAYWFFTKNYEELLQLLNL